MAIDFDKYRMISELVIKKAILHSVVKVELKKGSRLLEIVGAFATRGDSEKAKIWLEKNIPLEKGVYIISETPLKEWNGE